MPAIPGDYTQSYATTPRTCRYIAALPLWTKNWATPGLYSMAVLNSTSVWATRPSLNSCTPNMSCTTARRRRVVAFLGSESSARWKSASACCADRSVARRRVVSDNGCRPHPRQHTRAAHLLQLVDLQVRVATIQQEPRVHLPVMQLCHGGFGLHHFVVQRQRMAVVAALVLQNCHSCDHHKRHVAPVKSNARGDPLVKTK